MRILLAEDDPNISTITRLCLEKLGGHQVVATADGQAALEAGLLETFDLIILDGMMPNKNGLQAAHDLRQAGVKTPIIFLSAKCDTKAINEFLRAGSGYISKPFDPQKICHTINEIMNQAGVKAA